jgi:hypothetical protein
MRPARSRLAPTGSSPRHEVLVGRVDPVFNDVMASAPWFVGVADTGWSA